MASVRSIKKDIDYLVDEFIGDCYMTIYFHPNQQEKVMELLHNAVDLRNCLFASVNFIPEKNNPSLVKKHFAHIRRELMEKIDELFVKLSTICKNCNAK